jgi:hypothetical protein
MGKGKRNRQQREEWLGQGAPEDSVDFMLGRGAHVDPKTPVRRAHRQPDGMPPQEVIVEFIEDARQQGCTCPEPKVAIHKSASGNGGAINLLHEDHCPLIRVLDEQARG